jgi:hypothetical protein
MSHTSISSSGSTQQDVGGFCVFLLLVIRVDCVFDSKGVIVFP